MGALAGGVSSLPPPQAASAAVDANSAVSNGVWPRSAGAGCVTVVGAPSASSATWVARGSSYVVFMVIVVKRALFKWRSRHLITGQAQAGDTSVTKRNASLGGCCGPCGGMMGNCNTLWPAGGVCCVAALVARGMAPCPSALSVNPVGLGPRTPLGMDYGPVTDSFLQ